MKTASPSIAAPWRVRSYRHYALAQGFSHTGNWLSASALPWFVYDTHDSSFAVGLLMGLRLAPSLLNGVAGSWTDRFGSRRLVLVGESISLICCLLMAIAIWTRMDPLWLIGLLSTLTGIGTTLGSPGHQTLPLRLVNDKGLTLHVTSSQSAMFNVARLSGPLLAALMISTVGIAACFALDALSCIVMIFVIRRVTSADVEFRQERPTETGLLFVIRQYRKMWPTMMAFAGFAVLGPQLPVMLPALAREFSAGPAQSGVFNALIAGGALVGGVLASRGYVSERRLQYVLVGLALSTVAVAISPSAIWAAAPMVVLGAFEGMIFTVTATLLLDCVEEREQGRVMGLILMILFGGFIFGSVFCGAAIEVLGVQPAISLCGAATFAIAVLYRTSRYPINSGRRPTQK